MSGNIELGLTVFAAFFAIMNPISNTAVFVGLTEDEDKESQKKIALKALILTFAIIATFSIFGKSIYISSGSLRLACLDRSGSMERNSK